MYNVKVTQFYIKAGFVESFLKDGTEMTNPFIAVSKAEHASLYTKERAERVLSFVSNKYSKAEIVNA